VATFSYPTTAKLERIERDLVPRLRMDRPIFDLFPEVEEDTDVLSWELEDNFTGLMAVRGLNGDPPRVKRTGAKRYTMIPGVYGEFEPVDEAMLVKRRAYGTYNRPIEAGDLVTSIQEKLLGRDFDRREWMGWTLLATGTFSVPGPNGSILHTDSYTVQTYAAGVPWATVATAAPLNDFRQVQLLGRGHSVNFGAPAKAYLNRTTLNNVLNNFNNQDLYGRRTQGLGTFNNMASINGLLQGDDLPTLVPYDSGYLDDTGTFQLFIPNNTVIVVGQRPGGVPVGDFCTTRNVQNPDLGPRAYTKVIDKRETGVSGNILEVHRGWNGGIRIRWPSAIVRMSV
jgi:hypothetical protein